MVRQLDTAWNRFECSMYTIYDKLSRYGLVIIAGKTVYVPHREPTVGD